jgi:excisionase family DNA binding protein
MTGEEKLGSDFLKINEAARYLGVTRRWVYRRIWSGDLPASKVGGLYFIRQQDLDALIEQGKGAGVMKEPVASQTISLKCGYCLRLLGSDALIGDVCADEGCEELICTQCKAEGIRNCIQHVPDREQLWSAALEAYRRGETPVLVKARQARLREVSFLQRVQMRLGGISTLRHPLSEEVVTVQNWESLLEEGDERAEVMKLMNKVVLETEWLAQVPLNAHLLYSLPTSSKQKGAPISILVQVLSNSRTMIQKGFDNEPLGVDELTTRLLRIGEQAQRNQTLTLTLLASTTGWDSEARQLIAGGGPDLPFSHHWMLAYLNDIEKRELIYNRLDNRLRGYAELFVSLLPQEEVEEVISAIEKEMGVYESMTLQQAMQSLPYTRKSIEKAFEQLAASGDFALTEVPEIGLAIIRK